MPLADYAHHNEEAEAIWWAEEGRHADEPVEYDDAWYAGDEPDDLEDGEELMAYRLRRDDVFFHKGRQYTVVYNDDHGKRVLIGVVDPEGGELFFRSTDIVWRVF